MLIKINTPEFEVYTNQVIHPEEFTKLYNSDKILITFDTQINGVNNKPYATFLADKRNLTSIKIGEFIVMRAIKGKKKFEFVTKIGEWGKFHILKNIIRDLNLKNHEIVSFEVIYSSLKKETIIEKTIDISNCPNVSVLYRNNMITIVKGRTTPITMPRHIKITPNLIELCFLIHGDGHYNTKLFFVNKDSDLHRFVIAKFEEIFRIPKEIWRARLLFNNSANPNIAKERWRFKLGLKEEQFYPSISKCKLNTSELGNLRIVIDKLIVAHVFRNVFEAVKRNIAGKNAFYALNGLLCAEGSAEKTENGSLHKITINYSSKEKDMFKEILSESKISGLVKDRGDRFVIEGWENCYNFFKIFFSNNITPFNLHANRCNNALSGFLEHSFTKTMEKYLTILNRREQMNTNELITETKHLGNSVRKILRKKPYIQFVKSIGKGINRKPIIFSITPEGRDFLTLTKDIREVYNEKNGLR